MAESFVRWIVKAAILKHERLALRATNRGRQPCEAFMVRRRIRQQVARVTQRKRSISLQLSPNPNSCACLVSGQGEDQQEPRRRICLNRFAHLIAILSNRSAFPLMPL